MNWVQISNVKKPPAETSDLKIFKTEVKTDVDNYLRRVEREKRAKQLIFKNQDAQNISKSNEAEFLHQSNSANQPCRKESNAITRNSLIAKLKSNQMQQGLDVIDDILIKQENVNLV